MVTQPLPGRAFVRNPTHRFPRTYPRALHSRSRVANERCPLHGITSQRTSPRMKILSWTLRGAALVVALVAGATQLSAQTTTGSIGGRALGPGGEPVSGARVEAVN